MENGVSSMNKTRKIGTQAGTKISWYRPGRWVQNYTRNMTRFYLFGCKISHQVIQGGHVNDWLLPTVDNIAKILSFFSRRKLCVWSKSKIYIFHLVKVHLESAFPHFNILQFCLRINCVEFQFSPIEFLWRVVGKSVDVSAHTPVQQILCRRVQQILCRRIQFMT